MRATVPSYEPAAIHAAPVGARRCRALELLGRRNVLLHKLTTLGTKIPRHVSTGVNDTGTSVKSVSIRRHTTPAEASIRFDAFVLSVAAYLSER